MATIKDVAKAAGVSVATVSRVVNNGPKVGDETRKRVAQLMDELGYRPNANARALVTQKSASLGVVVPELNDPFFASLAYGIDQVARNHQMQLLLSTGLIEAKTERQALELLLRQRCDAIVLHSKSIPDDELITLAHSTPGLVLINRNIAEISDRCIWLDNHAGGEIAAQHLLSLGHRHVACVMSQYDIDDPSLRLNGFIKGMRAGNVAVDPLCISYGEPNQQGGEHAVRKLLANKRPITAIFVYNDAMASGVLSELADQGLRVPQDVSVVGFDDVLLARYMWPRLTTMRYPIEKMAIQAAELALSRCGHAIEDSIHHKYIPELISRDSSAQAPF